MAKIWTIEGEAGKALDATARDFAALKIVRGSAVLSMANMGAHRFVCRQELDRIDLTDETVPEEGQEVSVWHDDGTNTRAFVGTMIRRRGRHDASGSRMEWEVAGPDWWLRNIMLTGESSDQAENTRERTSFGLVEGTIGAGIESILDRAIALGAPIAKGTIAAGFTIPETTLPNLSCWDAIAEVLRYLADAVAWIDYTVAGTPTFNVTRRGSATAVSLALGTDEVVSVEAEGQYELLVTGVDLKHVERDSQRRQVYKEQLSGHGGTAQSGPSSTATYTGTAQSGGHAGTTSDLGDSGTLSGAMYVRDFVANASAQRVDIDQPIDRLEGFEIKIIAGTGVGQKRILTNHVGGGDFDIDREWATIPDTTSEFIVADRGFYAAGYLEEDIVGRWLKITSGPGAGEERFVVAYNETTGAGWVDEPWEDEDNAPDGGSGYDLEARNLLQLATTGVDDQYNGFIAALISGTGSGQRRTVVGGDDDLMTITPNWATMPDGTTGYSVGPADTVTVAAGTGAADMVGQVIRITGGTGSGQVRKITARSGDVLTVHKDWTTPPDGTSTYAIGPGTIQLAAAASEVDGAYNGLDVTIDSGTGSGQTKTIADYVGADREAIIDGEWTTNPDNTSVYTVGEGTPGTRRQVMAISGPELTPFLPDEEFDSEWVQSQLIENDSNGVVREAVARRFDTGLSGIDAQWPGMDLTPNTTAGTHPNDSSFEQIVPYAELENGADLPTGYRYFLVEGEVRDWWEDLGFRSFPVRVRGHYYYVETGGWGASPADWILQLLAHPNTREIKHTDDELWYYADFTFSAVNAYWPIPTKIYRQADYAFLEPPEGLAGNLASSQAFEPISGRIELDEETDPFPDHLQKVWNVSGGPSEWATMKALVAEAEWRPGTGKTTLRLGPPTRYDLRSIVRRMRREPADNITFL